VTILIIYLLVALLVFFILAATTRPDHAYYYHIRQALWLSAIWPVALLLGLWILIVKIWNSKIDRNY